MPRFSVVVPVYNRASSVLPTLQSVRDQTFTDFECIVVDDGSTDGGQLKAIVELLDDQRFRYVRRENGGAGAARNTGIDQADSDFVALIDSDDRWLPCKLARDESSCRENRVVFSPMLIERRSRITGQRPSRGPHSGEDMGDYLMLGGGFIPSSTVLVPRHLACAVRYDETVAFGDDADFAIRLAAHGAEFKFLAEASAIMADDEVGIRLSQSKDWQAVLNWADRIRPLISTRAYQAVRGWHAARLAAQAGEFGIAFRLFSTSLVKGALPLRLAAKAFVQIILPRSVYLRLNLVPHRWRSTMSSIE